MKYALFTALSMFSLFAFANDDLDSTRASSDATEYDYTQDLDIAKVVRISNASNSSTECGLVKSQLDYIDSKGVSHKLEYTRLGDGCQGG